MELNRNNMRTPWSPQARFQVLKARFEDSITSTAFFAQTIVPANVLNMLLTVIIVIEMFHSYSAMSGISYRTSIGSLSPSGPLGQRR